MITPCLSRSLRPALPALVLLLCAAPARAQLVDAASAAAEYNDVTNTPGPSGQNEAGAIKSGVENAPEGGRGPYGKGPNWVPGMPEPEKPEGQAEGQEKPAAPQNGRREGLILYDQYREPTVSADDGGARDEDIPEQYIVVKGDTLWGICDRFFHNPWYWPKLWSYNEMITNPHWIYPGDLISLYPPGQGPRRPPPALDKKPETPRRLSWRPSGPSGLILRQTGYAEPSELEAAGRIVGSKEEKIMLATNDEIYVEVNPKNPLKVGERYTIYRVTKPIRRPYGKRESLGNMVEILGDVQVRQVTSGGIARAVIREALAPIERGFRVGPLRRVLRLVDPVPNTVNQEGVLVETLVPSMVVGTEQLLFVDLGKKNGLDVGNRLLVIRRGDGYQKLLSLGPVDDRRYPKEVVAEIIILDAREHISAGLVMRSTKEVRVGDRVEARKGY